MYDVSGLVVESSKWSFPDCLYRVSQRRSQRNERAGEDRRRHRGLEGGGVAIKKYLYQEQVAWDIQRLFGRPFVYANANGNPAISKTVLRVFNKLTKEDVVWCRGDRFWRARASSDKPGRQQG
jgi:hypothetical protein